ncbi:carbonic anyhydrase, partial [Campylobacter coli]|nr:carbonic anyhydrase [Campylobacter coli]
MQAMDILNAIFYIKENSPFKLMRERGGVLERFCLEIHMADI